MNTLLALLALSPLLRTPQPTEPPARKRVFTPFEQVFTIVQGGNKVDSIALYLVEPGPFDWKGRGENSTEWKGIVFEKGFESRDALATFDRKRFEHAFDEPGIYALAFFRDGQEGKEGVPGNSSNSWYSQLASSGEQPVTTRIFRVGVSGISA